MPIGRPIEPALRTRFDALERCGKARRSAHFVAAIAMQNPAGGGPGRQNPLGDSRLRTTEPVPTQARKNEAAPPMKSRGVIRGDSAAIDGIEIYRIGGGGAASIKTLSIQPRAGSRARISCRPTECRGRSHD